MEDAQRERVEAAAIAVLDARTHEIAEAMLALSRREVPSYAAHGEPGFVEAARAHCLDHVRAFLTVARERRPLTDDELGFVRAQAAMRARQGVPLDALLHVYRMGHRAIFEAIIDTAGRAHGGADAALRLTERTLAHVDVISTTFTEAYLATRHEIDAGADAARRALLERAIAGAAGPGDDGRSRALGFDPDVPYAVAACRPADAASVHALAGRFGRDGLAIAREGEVVAVVSLAGRTSADVRDLVAGALGGGGGRAGVSLPCTGLREMPRGYAEALAALRAAGRDGVASLLELTPARYLTGTADETALRLLDPRIRETLAEDAARGGALVATLLAFMDADLSAPAAAEALHVHPNTVYHRLGRLERATGRSARRFHDLVELLVAVRLLGAGEAPQPVPPPRHAVPQRRPRSRPEPG